MFSPQKKIIFLKIEEKEVVLCKLVDVLANATMNITVKQGSGSSQPVVHLTLTWCCVNDISIKFLKRVMSCSENETVSRKFDVKSLTSYTWRTSDSQVEYWEISVAKFIYPSIYLFICLSTYLPDYLSDLYYLSIHHLFIDYRFRYRSDIHIKGSFFRHEWKKNSSTCFHWDNSQRKSTLPAWSRPNGYIQSMNSVEAIWIHSHQGHMALDWWINKGKSLSVWHPSKNFLAPVLPLGCGILSEGGFEPRSALVEENAHFSSET